MVKEAELTLIVRPSDRDTYFDGSVLATFISRICTNEVPSTHLDVKVGLYIARDACVTSWNSVSDHVTRLSLSFDHGHAYHAETGSLPQRPQEASTRRVANGVPF